MSNKIKAVRKYFNLSQNDFAIKLGIDKSWISLIENNKRSPGNRLIRDICKIFSVNESWLINATGDMFNSTSEKDLLLQSIMLKLDNQDTQTISMVEKLISLNDLDFKIISNLVDRLL